jgi:hypothetical protein
VPCQLTWAEDYGSEENGVMGRGRVEGENEGLEDGLGAGIKEAGEGGRGVWIGGVKEGFELVKRGFAS